MVADQLIARHGRPNAASTYDGKGICHIESGHERVARVEVTFRGGERPYGRFEDPSALLLADKSERDQSHPGLVRTGLGELLSVHRSSRPGCERERCRGSSVAFAA